MTQDIWTAVDRYLTEVLLPLDPGLNTALTASAQAGLPPIHVAPTEGKLLMLLAQLMRAQQILEIGTLGGYSTIWLARALPQDGRLITLEYDPKHAQVARANLDQVGLGDRVEIRIGRALDSLAQIAAENAAPFDLIFIDADKPSNPDYFRWALRLSHAGSLIIIDNVVREGAVIEADSRDASVQGVRQMLELIAAEPRVTATAIQTVSAKGYDGMAIVRVTADP
jgi:predicted O-methyltransferase YrrM